MEELAQSMASWAESSLVAASAAVRPQRVLSRPDLVKAGFKDSTAPITVIGRFHGAGLLSGTGPVNGTGLLNGAGVHNGAGLLNRKARFTRTSGTDQGLDTQRPVPASAAGRQLMTFLEDGETLLDSARLSAADDARLFGFVEAADFAGRVEEISRSLEYLQLVAAQAVERTRKEAQQTGPGTSAAAPEWRTGWTETETESAVSTGSTVAGATNAVATNAVATNAVVSSANAPSVLDDGYRNAAEFLRARLRIGIGEARRRLALAAEILPQAGMAGQEI
ncbi:HNH endonuclease, partial [Paenarthrobacter nitroguajacolicus]